MRIAAFVIGFVAAAAGFLAPTPAHAASGAWEFLTKDQVVAVEQKFAEALNDYRNSTDTKAEAKAAADKKNRAADKATSGLLRDLAQRDVDDGRRLNRKPKYQSDEDRVRDNTPKAGESDEAFNARNARRKSLRDLIAELDKPSDDPALKKYSKEYAGMLYEAFLKEPKKFSELAGEISAGEYGKIAPTVEKASAALLTKAVGDLLAAYNYETSKQIWDGFTGNIEDFQDVGSSLLRGDWPKFRTSLKALGMKKATAATEEAVKQTVGFALGDKAGSVYVKLIKAEIEFLKWSDKTLRSTASVPCLRLYVDEYNRVGGPGAQSVAYAEFKACSEERGKYLGYVALQEYIVLNGLNVDAIYGQLAEDYRLGKTTSVQTWLAELVELRKREVETQWEKEFAAWSGRIGDVNSRVHKASTKLLNYIIEDVLGEDRLKELENAADKALMDTFQDVNLLERIADGVTGACTSFDAVKAEAQRILKSAEEADTLAEALEARAQRFTGCNSDATALASLKRLFENVQKVSRDFDRERQSAEGEIDGACRAREAIAPPISQADAQLKLAAVNAAASRAQAAITAAELAFGELGKFAKLSGDLKFGGDRQARDELAQIIAEAQQNVMPRPEREQKLREAKGRMFAEVRTVQALEGIAKDLADKIKAVLAPHRASPLRQQILVTEDAIKEQLDGIADCRRSIVDIFNAGENGGPPWRSQNLGTLATSAMQTAVEAAKSRCPAGPGEDPSTTTRAIADLLARADSEMGILGIGKGSYERCVQEAKLAAANVDAAATAAANAVLTMQAPIPDDPKLFAGTWTVADGSVTQESYSGEYISKGTYSWNPPPATIGPQGFSITMSATCMTGPRQGSLSTGIGVSAEGFDVVKSLGDRTPAKLEETRVPVVCGSGQSNSGSVTVNIKPYASYSEGYVAKLKIGAFYGAGVTYRYVAGKPAQ